MVINKKVPEMTETTLRKLGVMSEIISVLSSKEGQAWLYSLSKFERLVLLSQIAPDKVKIEVR